MSLGAGLSGGYSSNSSKSTTNQNQANTYSPGQSSLQNSLTSFLQSLLPGMNAGGISQPIQNMETQSADQINRNYSTVGDTTNEALASRGFGKSGATGSNVLQTELGRQGAQANNAANYGALQLQQNNSMLSDALAAAYQSLGQTLIGSNTGKDSGWGIAGSLGAGGKV